MVMAYSFLALASLLAGVASANNAGSELLSGVSLLHRWASGEKGLSCDVTCNGNTDKDIAPGSSWPLYQCWGSFTSECGKTMQMKGDDKGTYKLHTFAHCEGAFATIKNGTDDDAHALGFGLGKHSSSDDGKGFFGMGCEGHYFALTKVVPVTGQDAAHAAVTANGTPGLTELGISLALSQGRSIGTRHGHHGRKCRKTRLQDAHNGGVTGHLNAVACSGSYKVFAVGEEGVEGTVYSKCSHGFAAGEATKTFARSATSKDIARAFRVAEKHVRKYDVKADLNGALEGLRGAGDVAAGIDSSEAAQLASGASRGGGMCAATQDRLGRPPQCKATCNGKGLTLSGWLPCKGELEGKCEGSKVAHGADVCYVEDTKCEGLSWPKFKMCAGLFTALNKVAGESKEGEDFNVERLSIVNGYTRGKKVSKHGWQGALLVGKGPSSLRVHAGKGSAPDAGATVGAALGGAAVRALDGSSGDRA